MAIHDQPNASPGRRVSRSHRRGSHQLLEGREGRRLDRSLVGHVAPARGDSSRPKRKLGPLPNRERGTLSPAPRPSKAARGFPTCTLQVGLSRRTSSAGRFGRPSGSSEGRARRRKSLDRYRPSRGDKHPSTKAARACRGTSRAAPILWAEAESLAPEEPRKCGSFPGCPAPITSLRSPTYLRSEEAILLSWVPT